MCACANVCVCVCRVGVKWPRVFFSAQRPRHARRTSTATRARTHLVADVAKEQRADGAEDKADGVRAWVGLCGVRWVGGWVGGWVGAERRRECTHTHTHARAPDGGAGALCSSSQLTPVRQCLRGRVARSKEDLLEHRVELRVRVEVKLLCGGGEGGGDDGDDDDDDDESPGLRRRRHVDEGFAATAAGEKQGGASFGHFGRPRKADGAAGRGGGVSGLSRQAAWPSAQLVTARRTRCPGHRARPRGAQLQWLCIPSRMHAREGAKPRRRRQEGTGVFVDRRVFFWLTPVSVGERQEERGSAARRVSL